MVVAVAKAVEDGARAIICASTGNTSASAAAYGAAHGLEVVVVLPAGKIAMGKLLQAIVAGARVVAVDGNFDAALRVVRALAEQDDHPVTLVNSVNPYRLEGQKTAAFEICDDLGRAPDVLAIPVGNAGNISAYWAGFREYAAAGLVASTPRMFGFQAAGAAPLVQRPAGRRAGDDRDRDPDRQPRVVDRRRSPPATRAAAGSTPSPTTRSSPRTGPSRPRRGSSASRRRRRAWPASSASAARRARIAARRAASSAS